MKIKWIELVDNAFWGNVQFDFTDDGGNAVDTILIIGENGCGKTQLLNIIYDFSRLDLDGPISNEKRIFDIVLSKDEMAAILAQERLAPIFEHATGELRIIQDFTVKPHDWKRFKITGYCICGEGEHLIEKNIDAFTFFNDTGLKGLFKSIYSTVEINYNPAVTSMVTSKEIDESVLGSVKSGTDLASEIQQLFVDIQNNDANDLLLWVKENIGQVPPPKVIDRRISRFKRAFSIIFDNLNYSEIKTQSNKKTVVFKKNGCEIDISSLSSGEKQIVFRGAFLLKNQQSIRGSVVLIDEPEISLHPIWQQKILGYYRNLFTASDGSQTSQLFVATHSPFIIHNAERYNDKVIILGNDQGKAKIEYSGEYVTTDTPAIIQRAFNISVFRSEIKTGITVFVEGETDETYYNTYINQFMNIPADIRFCWIGSYNKDGNTFNTGDTGLNHLLAFLRANQNLISESVVLLYDSDTNKQDESFGSISVRVMPKNQKNELYLIGVENLLNLPPDFNAEQFYKTSKRKDKYGALSTIRELDKTKLCDFICKNENAREYLSNLEAIIIDISTHCGQATLSK